MDKFKARQSALLLITATIWGIAFVAQSIGNEYIGPFTFSCVRSFIGGLTLLPVIAVRAALRKRGRESSEADNAGQGAAGAALGDGKVADSHSRAALIKAGILCGLALCAGELLQQISLLYEPAGKAGFMTALYIVLVPVAGMFLGRKAGARVFIAVIIAVAGLYMLCMGGGSFSFGTGEVLLLLCAVAFTVQILVIDHFAPLVDGVKLACIQFFVCGAVSSVGLIWERPTVSAIISGWAPILYAGVLSCGVAYTLQIIGQRGLDPTVASLIMCMESVVSVLAGWIILGQALTGREIFGCVLMFAAIILAQLPAGAAGKKAAES